MIALDVTNLPPVGAPVDPWVPPNWCAFPASSPGGGNVHSTWMDDANGYLYVSIGDVATNVYDMRGFAYYNANTVLSLAQSPPVVIQAGSNPPQVLHYPMLDSHELRTEDQQHPVRFEMSADWMDVT